MKPLQYLHPASIIPTVITQVEILLFFILGLILLVALTASTFIIIALSKFLDLIPLDLGGDDDPEDGDGTA